MRKNLKELEVVNEGSGARQYQLLNINMLQMQTTRMRKEKWYSLLQLTGCIHSFLGALEF